MSSESTLVVFRQLVCPIDATNTDDAHPNGRVNPGPNTRSEKIVYRSIVEGCPYQVETFASHFPLTIGPTTYTFQDFIDAVEHKNLGGADVVPDGLFFMPSIPGICSYDPLSGADSPLISNGWSVDI